MGQITDIDELIEGYQLFCQAERRSRRSICWYMHKLPHLGEIPSESGLSP